MKWIARLFSNDAGEPSIQRVQSTLLIISGIIYAFVYKDAVNASILIGLGVGEKLGQKIMEKMK
jgi:hypothetical protein